MPRSRSTTCRTFYGRCTTCRLHARTWVKYGEEFYDPLSEEEKLCLINPARFPKRRHFAEAIAFSHKWDGRTFQYRFREANGRQAEGKRPRLCDPETWNGEIFKLVPVLWGIGLIAVFAEEAATACSSCVSGVRSARCRKVVPLQSGRGAGRID